MSKPNKLARMMARSRPGRPKKKKKAPNSTYTVDDLGPPEELVDEVKAIWSKDISNLPVYKDLPRLARRIAVLGSLEPLTPQQKLAGSPRTGTSLSPKTKPPPLPPIQNRTAIPKDGQDKISAPFEIYLNTDTIESYRASQWSKNYVICNLVLFKIKKTSTVAVRIYRSKEDSTDKTYCQANVNRLVAVQDSTRYFIIESVYAHKHEALTNVGFAFCTREEAVNFKQLLSEYTESQQVIRAPKNAREGSKLEVKDIESEEDVDPGIETLESFTKDVLKELGPSMTKSTLNQLRDSVANRLSIIGRSAKTTKPDEASDSPDMRAVKRAVLAVAKELETQERYNKIRDEFDRVISEGYDGDLQLIVEQLFKNAIGTDSKTARVFKSIHQNIIFACAYQIKSTVTTGFMTGDVRGPEGWQIAVLFASDVISISHRRREKSLGTKDSDSFWFEWVLHMTFDCEMKDLQGTALKIIDLQFDGNPDVRFKEKITNAFCGGDLLIS
eukprot:CAMPEP_0168522598 /NCGR_PEP_ID=MMETSP0405-20121227/9441_1 /TAXON_ID=498012 /ORGANISM="Trichosphaerium sp, Strain Am-I-7 wt" /LENGTH=498 /DNA_ID=CAMNT_0008544227 /DNA_START=40 /DNA_END=1536 /DNA_ORIENTATION=+